MMDRLPNCFRCGHQPCLCKDGGTLYLGDCLDVLRAMPAGVVQSVTKCHGYRQTCDCPAHEPAAKRIGKTPRWKMRRLAQEGKKVAKSANNGRQESLF
jgi:hypothetical protein